MRSVLHTALSVVLALLAARGYPAHAQSYPQKPLKLIVPFPVSGPNDIFGTTRASKLFKLVSTQAPPAVTEVVARSVAYSLSAMLGQPVKIERVPRGNSVNGTVAAAQAPPDGYTLLLGGNVAMVINPGLFPKLAYRVTQDFVPVALVATMPLALMVHENLPVTDVPDLIAYVRQRPGIVNYGSSGDGSTGHLAGELFKSLTATNMVHVSFNGGVNALTGVQTGQVQLGFIALPLVLPYALQGKRTLLALTSAKRFSALPDLPTLAEAGMPGYHAEAWYGIFVPARTPRSTVETLNAAVVNSLKLPGTAALYRSHGVEAAGNAPEEFAAMIREELARWSQVIKVGLATPE